MNAFDTNLMEFVEGRDSAFSFGGQEFASIHTEDCYTLCIKTPDRGYVVVDDDLPSVPDDEHAYHWNAKDVAEFSTLPQARPNNNLKGK